ncbi:MAG: thioredoxin-dependent thiol peroxidase [Elainellaceae cyanobacterium]
MALQIGDPAPDFSLPDGDGQIVNLADFQGQRVVLYFYPRDNTPGCTKEACGFRDAYADYQARDAVVLGVSTDDAKSHTKFSTKHSLPFPLLTDADGQVATAYGCYGLKKFMGKEYVGITRSTFIIGPDGTIEKIYSKVKPEPHAAEVLADLDQLQGESKLLP